MNHKGTRMVHSWLAVLLSVGLMLSGPLLAKRKIEQYNLPTPQSFANYELRVEASNRRPEAGQAVIFKAIISPAIDDNDVEYHFLINGAAVPEPGMHKVYTFQETGTYKVSAVARLGGSYLLNSPPVIIHVIEDWLEPEAVISPRTLTVQSGQDAIFESLSEIDPQSRQWLYWSVSTGHRGTGDKFLIKTDKLKPGKYPIELKARDDRKRESIAHAFLVVTDKEVETLTLHGSDDEENMPLTISNSPANIELRASHSNRLQDMQIIFWIQNAQPGADTELQLDSGDGLVTPWSKKLRYGHRYQQIGIYQAHINARTPSGDIRSNSMTVYVWPLWLPVLMVISGLLLAGIPFFKRRQRRRKEPAPVSYQLHPDPGFHQLILTSEQQSPAMVINHSMHSGHQILTVWNQEKNENDN